MKLICVSTNKATKDMERTSVNKSIIVRIRLPPKSMKMNYTGEILEGGKERLIECKAEGANPAPVIVWKRNGETIESQVTNKHKNKQMISILHFTPRPEDDRHNLSCEAKTPGIKEKQKVTKVMIVTSRPRCVKKISEIIVGELEEKINITCPVKANPNHNLKFTWYTEAKGKGKSNTRRKEKKEIEWVWEDKQPPIKCYGINGIGRQIKPCTILIKKKKQCKNTDMGILLGLCINVERQETIFKSVIIITLGMGSLLLVKIAYKKGKRNNQEAVIKKCNSKDPGIKQTIKEERTSDSPIPPPMDRIKRWDKILENSSKRKKSIQSRNNKETDKRNGDINTYINEHYMTYQDTRSVVTKNKGKRGINKLEDVTEELNQIMSDINCLRTEENEQTNAEHTKE